ncbi:Maf family protein [Chromatiaceae bacterium AAb-1]|nr:Maf family protein [Chromatiaceae bacterium AAb-1]
MAAHPPIWLASTSAYRRELLQKLTGKFHYAAPDTDETPLPGETAAALVQRLSLAKARSVAAGLTDGLVIGSDQVAVYQQQIIGKPHTEQNAIAQLTQFSGQQITFLTGLAVVNVATGNAQVITEPFIVHFRQLSGAEIQAYIKREQPLNCAGSFKSEGLGISLFSKLEGNDPNALIGLPLIRLNQLLLNEGVNLLLQSDNL